MGRKQRDRKKEEERKLYLKILILDVIIFSLFFSFFLFILNSAYADVGGNATMSSELEVGASAPIIKSINVDGGLVVLIPNNTKVVNCTVEIEDFDTDIDIKNVSAKLFYNASSYDDSDDNNYHYTNESCYIDTSYGDENTALAHCLFNVWYYANHGEWNCSVNVTDYSGYNTFGSNTTIVESLLAVGLPESLDYGIVNSTYVSQEKILNVTNYGNVKINLSLYGYAISEGDGFAMNCSLGGNILIDYEKYNLTESNPGALDLSNFESLYVNLTSSPVVREFNLDYRQNDSINDAINETYWRIYVPIGVGGTCQGNIVFGAVQQAEG